MNNSHMAAALRANPQLALLRSVPPCAGASRLLALCYGVCNPPFPAPRCRYREMDFAREVGNAQVPDDASGNRAKRVAVLVVNQAGLQPGQRADFWVWPLLGPLVDMGDQGHEWMSGDAGVCHPPWWACVATRLLRGGCRRDVRDASDGRGEGLLGCREARAQEARQGTGHDHAP